MVLSANQCMTKANLPAWITGIDKEEKAAPVGVNGHAANPPRLRRKSTIVEDGNEIVLPDLTKSGEQSQNVDKKPDVEKFVSRGGSSIVSPQGEVLAGPLWDDENGLLTVDMDFDDCLRGRLDLDVGGSYSRYVLASRLSGEYTDLDQERFFQVDCGGPGFKSTSMKRNLCQSHRFLPWIHIDGTKTIY